MPQRESTPAERQIQVRQVTHVQASWTEQERGGPGAFTLQLILDHGADEYVLRPSAEDADVLVKLLARLELGDAIPEALYRTIAEIIAFAWYLKGKCPAGFTGQADTPLIPRLNGPVR